MNETRTIQKIGLYQLLAVLLFIPGLIIIHLPITPAPNRPLIYLVVVFVGVFSLIWNRLNFPISNRVKDIFGAIVDIFAISLLVHWSGGVSSYFSFLYLLPVLYTAIRSTTVYTAIVWLITSTFIWGEVLFFPQVPIPAFAVLNSPYILAALNSWAVGLAAAYGRFTSKEFESAQGDVVTINLEKEQSVNKLKDEFIFIISHELRSPITAIRGYLEILLTGSKIPQLAKVSAQAAFEQSDRLNNLIAELLDISRLETDKFQLASEDFDINQLVSEVVKSFEKEAQRKKIELLPAPSTEPLQINADRERVREVLNSLVENAIKFTGEFGRVLLWFEQKEGKMSLSVADTGPGIDPADLPHLFDKFYKPTSSSVQAEPRSFGFGLFLTKNLVEKMGGEIFVESQLGKGTKFTFSLPLAKKNK